jgi:FtsH-binding integral membrane protein
MSRTNARGLESYAEPVIYASEATRGTFLQRIATYTAGGLAIASVTSIASAFVVAQGPDILRNQWVAIGIMFGMFFFAQNIAAGMVYEGQNKLVGFVAGTAAQGVAMGYLLIAAVGVGAQVYGTEGFGPFTIVVQAMGLTMLTALSMVGYLWTNPKDLSMIRGALSIMAIPMLALMVLTVVFPIGGTLGLIISVVFVATSGAGLLYQLNQVLHSMPAHMYVEGAYSVTLGVLVLFWNLVTLLMRLSSSNRD